MTQVPVREVARDTITNAARLAIKDVRDENGFAFVSTSLVRRLMKVARTYDRFLLGTWYREDCGCLIGNLRGPDIDCEGLSAVEYEIGVAFDQALNHLKKRPHPRTVLQVAS